jgi:hypothetical protein
MTVNPVGQKQEGRAGTELPMKKCQNGRQKFFFDVMSEV